MKQSCRGFLAASLVLSSCVVSHAQASEVLNIPSSSAIERHADPLDACNINLGASIGADTPAPSGCFLDFPLTIPAGHTIDQIYVFHGTAVGVPNPFIDAFVATQAVVPPYNNNWSFDYQSTAAVPAGTIASSRLMAQAGKVYVDAFLVRTDTVYHVVVHLVNGAYVSGLQVIYD